MGWKLFQRSFGRETHDLDLDLDPWISQHWTYWTHSTFPQKETEILSDWCHVMPGGWPFGLTEQATAFAELVALRAWVGVGATCFDAVEAELGGFANLIRNVDLVPLADLRVALVAVKFVPAEGQDACPQICATGPMWVGLAHRMAHAGNGQTWASYVYEDLFATSPPSQLHRTALMPQSAALSAPPKSCV
eukprot:4404359-Amphidinium_carterae.1